MGFDGAFPVPDIVGHGWDGAFPMGWLGIPTVHAPPVVLPLNISSISLDRVPRDGGYRIDLVGGFPENEPLYVFIGPTGTPNDYKCLAGKAGYGSEIYATTTTKLKCYTPMLPVGGPYDILVKVIGTGEEALLPEAISVIRQDFKSCVYSVRSPFPPVFIVGPKKAEDEEPI